MNTLRSAQGQYALVVAAGDKACLVDVENLRGVELLGYGQLEHGLEQIPEVGLVDLISCT